MASNTRPFVFGALVGGLVGGVIGGIAGYVINDLTSVENPEVVQQIQETQALQQNFDDFLNNLPAPDATAGSGATP